jgi:predicted nucleic acid-binding protein
MTIAIVDTTVIVHLLRRYPPALVWFASQSQRLSITSTTWLEIMEGATNRVHQARCKSALTQFDLIHLTSVDQQWAMQQLEQLQFSHHPDKDDCLIASVAYSLQVPLYTHNLKHMLPLIGFLAVQPYV